MGEPGRPGSMSPHVQPPSTVNSAPVQYEASSDARNSAMYAISMGSAMRGMGILAKTGATAAASPLGLPISVLTPPGWIEFTRIPKWPSSMAAVLVMPRMANFDAEYDTRPFLEPCPSIDEMLTIEPPPA